MNQFNNKADDLVFFLKAGVKLNDKGYVKVDPYQETSTPTIFAVGDVTGNVELTPVAIAAGRRLSDRFVWPWPRGEF